MQTLSNRRGVVLVSLLVVLSTISVVPLAGAAPVDTYAQQGTDDGSNDDTSGDGASVYDNATEVESIGAIENGEIGADGAAAVFSFSLNEGTQVEITQGIGGGALPVTLLDRDGEVLGRIADQAVYEGEEDLIRANASYTGTYYLKIDGEPGERYSISESVTEPDANEPNDDRGSATTIALGELERGTLVRGDVDYYAVQLDAGERVGLVTNATAAAGVTVYGPEGEELGSADAPTPGGERESERGVTPVVNATAPEDGTYYVAVSVQPNTIGNVNGEYTLAVVNTSDDDEATTTTDESETTEDGSNERTETTDDPTTESDAAGGSDGTATEGPETTDAAVETTTVGETAGETTSAETGTGTGAAGPTSTASETADAPATDSAAGGTATTETASGGVSGVDESVEETAVNGPGFGVVAGAVALLGAALLAARRH